MQVLYGVDAVICLLIAFIFWLLPSLAERTLAFGVRIPVERATDAAVVRARRVYHALLFISVVVAAAVTWVFVVTGASATAIALSPLILVALEMSGYYVAHRIVRHAKERGDWYAGLREGMVAEVPSRPRAAFPYLWAVLPVLVILVTAVILVRALPTLPTTLPTHFDLSGHANGFSPRIPGAFIPLATQIFSTILIGSIAVFIPKYRHALDPSDPKGSVERGRIFQRRWMRALMVIITLINLSQFYFGLITWQLAAPSGILTAIVALTPALAIIAIVIALALNTGQGGARLRAIRQGQATGLVYRDDDAYWKAGLFYFNHDDPALFVERRFGIGWTLNLAHPAAWAVLGMLAVVVIVSLVVAPHRPR